MPTNKEPAKKANVIAEVIRVMELGRLIPSNHAQQRMKDRDIQLSDIEEAIYNSTREESQDRLTDDGTAWKYALRGPNKAGDKDLRIVVLFIEPDALIVTVIDKNKKEDKK